MKATLTSKGQITIPAGIRKRLRLMPGDVLEFDEEAPFLKASKGIEKGAFERFRRNWTNPWPGRTGVEILDELRGPVDLPGKAE